MVADVPDHPLTALSRRLLRGLERLVATVLVAALLACFARTFLLQAFRIPSASMGPGLVAGDHLLVNKFIYGPTLHPWERRWLPLRPPRRGDIVVFRYPLDPEHDFIKRVVALPGDRLRIRDKAVVVNGEPLTEESYVSFADPRTYPNVPLLEDRLRRRDNFGPAEIPQDRLFVLGDNRDLSSDSRFWGTVPRHFVKGRPVLRLWSLAPAEDGSSLLTRVRWRRSLDAVR